MTILRDGRPVTTVMLGEELELRWTIFSKAESAEVSSFAKKFLDEIFYGIHSLLNNKP